MSDQRVLSDLFYPRHLRWLQLLPGQAPLALLPYIMPAALVGAQNPVAIELPPRIKALV
jgi:hypothetical protein